jgi:hypothetical protein
MLVSQKLAIAAHMHVMLRRKTGRVTDTEWMAENLDYALEVVRFARAKATEDNHPDLHEWADKLERAVLDKAAAPAKPLLQTAVQAMRERSAAPAPTPVTERTGGFVASVFGQSSGFSDSTLDPEKTAKRDPNVPRYVGGIR